MSDGNGNGPDPLAITTVSLPLATRGEPYLADLQATGGTPPYEWELATGVRAIFTVAVTDEWGQQASAELTFRMFGMGLPDGLVLDPEGAILGSPEFTAMVTIDVAVIDSDGARVEASFMLSILDPPPPPPPPPQRVLPSVVWDGMELMDVDSGLIVTDFAGWYGTPDVNVGDVERTLVDGMAPGPKTLAAREMTLEGWIIGSVRQEVTDPGERLDALSAGRAPSLMTVEDPFLGRRLQAEVRGIGPLEWTWRGPLAMQYQVSLRATDPRLYEEQIQSATLTRTVDEVTGRVYGSADAPEGGRNYRMDPDPPGGWRYRGSVVQSQAVMRQAGNVDAPVVLLYVGPLAQSRVTDGERAIIFRALQPGEQIWVNSETLTAWATGGHTRNSFVLPGSRPMLIPPGNRETTWSLYALDGTGFISLTWRAAWL